MVNKVAKIEFKGGTIEVPIIDESGSGSGDMEVAVYDPNHKRTDAFDYANMSGTEVSAENSVPEVNQYTYALSTFQTRAQTDDYSFISTTSGSSNVALTRQSDENSPIKSDSSFTIEANATKGEDAIQASVNINAFADDTGNIGTIIDMGSETDVNCQCKIGLGYNEDAEPVYGQTGQVISVDENGSAKWQDLSENAVIKSLMDRISVLENKK